MKIHPILRRTVVAAALGGLLGLGLRAVLPDRGHPAFPEASEKRVRSIGSDDVQSRGHNTIARQHTLTALKSMAGIDGYVAPEVGMNIERMSSAELRDLLRRLDTNFSTVSSTTATILRGQILVVAAAELFHREGETALNWASELPLTIDGVHSLAFDDLLTAAMRIDPALACRWIVAGREKRGQEWTEEKLTAAYNHAFGVSAQGVLEVERAMPAVSTPYPHRIAEDFDFRSYLANTKTSSGTALLATYLAGQDPEEAWSAMQPRLGENPYLFGALCQGVSYRFDDAGLAKWAAEKLEALPLEARATALSSMAMMSPVLSPAAQRSRTKACMEALAGTAEQWIYAACAFRPIQVNGSGEGPDVTGLSMLESEETQVRALSWRIRRFGQYSKGLNDKVWEGYESAMDQLGFTEEAKEKVREIKEPASPPAEDP